MTTDVDICNRALAEIGARSVVTTLAEATPQGRACTLFYNPMRQMILRAAPWAFARKTLAVTPIGLLTDNPPASPYPWAAKYAYPADCLKVRYVLQTPVNPIVSGVPNVSDVGFDPYMMPSRSNRYLPAYDDTGMAPAKVLLSNLINLTLVYTVDAVNPDLFDPLFVDALAMGLANKLVMPLSGNVKLKSSFAQMAEQAILTARAVDGNEAVPSTSHTPDWIATRGAEPSGGMAPGFQGGQWFGGDENINWGM